MPLCEDERLNDIGEMIPEILTKAIAVNTFRTYAQGWRQWRRWSDEFRETGGLPIKSFYLCLFLTAILQSKAPFGRIEVVFNGLSWLHKTLGLPNPCESVTVRAIKESAKRELKKPPTRKLPVSPHVLEKMVVRLRTDDLTSMRTLTIAMLSYAGFLRYDDVSQIRRENIVFLNVYFKIFLPSSKTDQHNDGETVIIARTGNVTCPYMILSEYLRLARISRDDQMYVFRAMSRTKAGCVLRKMDKPISYTTVRDDVLKEIEAVGEDRANYGVHSFRRGGATQAARAGVEDRLFKKHGRWLSDKAKDGYVEESLAQKLSVTQRLGI